MPIQEPEHEQVELDNGGYLTDYTRWTEAVARRMAEQEGLELGDDHLKVIRLIRDFHARHKVTPMLTHVSRESGLSYRELQALFGKQPGKHAARLAGLPKPSGCT